MEIEDGECMAILGPSGCGKSTLLRIIAGLEEQDQGDVFYGLENMANKWPRHRGIGVVFENFALYPRKTDFNVLSYFKLGNKKISAKEEEVRIKVAARILGVDLKALLDRRPEQLSGGEQQRVAIARCITRDPKLFLLDEPFSNLDAKMRNDYRIELKKLIKHFKITTVYVTHDQKEGVSLGDRIAVMSEGRIQQIGTYKQLYDKPANIFVAEFFGNEKYKAINLIPGEFLGKENKIIGVRPENTAISTERKDKMLEARVEKAQYDPALKKSIVSFNMGGFFYTALTDKKQLKPMDAVFIHFKKSVEFDKSF
jgi:ABC-type sugar transport system ATPase subunit